jgi:hypothetical protein
MRVRFAAIALALVVSLGTVLPVAAQPPAGDPAGKSCTAVLAGHLGTLDTAGYSEFGQHHAAMAQQGMLGKDMNPGMHTGLAGLCK